MRLSKIKLLGVVLGVVLITSACCGNRPVMNKEVQLQHDLLTDLVFITDLRKEKGKPVVDLYIRNPRHYKLNVYQVDTGR